MLYTADVQFTESAEQASTPPSGLTELPTCPVCLGKLQHNFLSWGSCSHKVIKE